MTNNPSLTKAHENYRNDEERLKTQRGALLALLRDGNWHPNYELAEVAGLSFNSYLYQLRRAGWEIRSRRVHGGIWQQKLFGRRSLPLVPPSDLSGPQKRVLDAVASAIRRAYGDEGINRISPHLPPWLTGTLASH